MCFEDDEDDLNEEKSGFDIVKILELMGDWADGVLSNVTEAKAVFGDDEESMAMYSAILGLAGDMKVANVQAHQMITKIISTIRTINAVSKVLSERCKGDVSEVIPTCPVQAVCVVIPFGDKSNLH